MKKKFIFFILFLFLVDMKVFTKTPVEITGDEGSKTQKVDEKNGEKLFITEIPNPVIKFGNTELRADKGRIYGKNNSMAEVAGHVTLIDKKNNSRVNADKAIFNRETNIIEFTGKPVATVKREEDNSIVNIQADIFKYFIDEKILEADQNVKLKNNDLNLSSGKAVLKRDEKKVIFLEQPVINKGNDIYKADEIFYFMDKKIVMLEKNAHITAYSETRDQETKEIKKIQVIADGKKFVWQGDKNSEDLTGFDVHIISKSDNIEAFGNNFKSFKKDGCYNLWGKACMIFKSEKTDEETLRVYGDFMEYYQDIEELNVSGNVDMINKDGNIRGNLAKYQKKNDIMIVTGNASIEKDKSKVFARSITINTKSNETFIEGNIRGNGIN